jgi:iron(III) transport system ATP-binding protein
VSNLVVQDLHLKYGVVEVLKGISFELTSGKVLALLGASGCGKTTLLRTIAGLELPSNGRIVVGNQVLFDSATNTELAPEKRNLGLVFQSYALWPHKSVYSNVAFPLELKRTPAEETRRRVSFVLESLGLGGLAERYPHQLSGGQQQRVAIARAVVHQPPVILLDEPLSNLDAKLREEARIWMRRLIDDLGITAVLVTHDQVEAMALADHIILLSSGHVEQRGTPQELYGTPETLAAAEFMGANNRLRAVVTKCEGNAAQVTIGSSPMRAMVRTKVKPGDTCDALIRVERVEVGPGACANSIPMQLATCVYLGERWECLFEADGIKVRCYSGDAVPPGQHHIRLKEESLWLF